MTCHFQWLNVEHPLFTILVGVDVDFLQSDGIVEALKLRGYVLESEADGVLKLHLSSPVNRAFRFWEDTITLTPVLEGWEAEGLSRDLVRVVSSIEQYFRNHGQD